MHGFISIPLMDVFGWQDAVAGPHIDKAGLCIALTVRRCVYGVRVEIGVFVVAIAELDPALDKTL